ncbi:MAG: hypothetical protein JWQ54_3205 [Mucilaginibacter sp.]|nr:hypothetical protein [Mucilaginibacter sp.]
MESKFKINDNVVLIDHPYQGTMLIEECYEDGTYLCYYKERTKESKYMPVPKRSVFKEVDLMYPLSRTIILRPNLNR